MPREVSLSGGRVALVDDNDYETVMAAGPWQASLCGDHYYARRQVRIGALSVTVAMHSFLTGWRLVDHVNGDGLDNRRVNIRPATPAQNSMNQRRSRRNKTGYKGVGFHRASGRWRAYIGIQGRQTSLGYYDDPELAARAYDRAAIEHFGEFAHLNFNQENAA